MVVFLHGAGDGKFSAAGHSAWLAVRLAMSAFSFPSLASNMFKEARAGSLASFSGLGHEFSKPASLADKAWQGEGADSFR